jgi:hypothetical protein
VAIFFGIRSARPEFPVHPSARFAMRLSKALLATLTVAMTTALFAGCASQSNVRAQDTVILGGLYASQPAAFDQQTSTGIPVNSDKPSRKRKMSGDKVSILWGLFTFRDQ